MIIYRAELEDGGGPFYDRKGIPRQQNMPTFINSNILYGADSVDNLKILLNNYGFNIEDFYIKKYKSTNIISYNRKNGHIVFIEEIKEPNE